MEKKYEDGYREGYTNAALDLSIALSKETKQFSNRTISVKKLGKIVKALVGSTRSQIKKDLQIIPK